jgi:hypothetical protein
LGCRKSKDSRDRLLGLCGRAVERRDHPTG